MDHQRTRLLLLVIAGILIICGITSFLTVTTVRAIQELRMQTILARERNTSTLQPWMTLSYVSILYHVPVSVLEGSLQAHNIASTSTWSIHALALHAHLSDKRLLQILQHSIDVYRKGISPPWYNPDPTASPAFKVEHQLEKSV